jgi:hypothetical protein
VDAPNIPGRPHTWTEEQKEQAIAFLATKSLKELRRRQALQESQHRFATSGSGHVPRYVEDGLNDLQVMMNLETAAIMRREFGE